MLYVIKREKDGAYLCDITRIHEGANYTRELDAATLYGSEDAARAEVRRGERIQAVEGRLTEVLRG